MEILRRNIELITCHLHLQGNYKLHPLDSTGTVLGIY